MASQRNSAQKKIIVPDERIRRVADWQTNWGAVIEPLHQGKFWLNEDNFTSMAGDAPKNFIHVKDYVSGRPCHHSRPLDWPAYIAKVGSKWYPIESVTEHLVTRVGQVAGATIAESQLRIVGRQVRFLSKYFLRRGYEYLSHGLEIFEGQIGKELVEHIHEKREEKEWYTFQAICKAIEAEWPNYYQEIMAAFVEMLAFDALVGNHDRHPANWGVVVPVSRYVPPRFSPIYDTARALFWNIPEKQVVGKFQSDPALEKYVRESLPEIGWDHCDNPRTFNHFDLIQAVGTDFPEYRPSLRKFTTPDLPQRWAAMIEAEFKDLLSAARRELIARCLAARHELYCQASVWKK